MPLYERKLCRIKYSLEQEINFPLVKIKICRAVHNISKFPRLKPSSVWIINKGKVRYTKSEIISKSKISTNNYEIRLAILEILRLLVNLQFNCNQDDMCSISKSSKWKLTITKWNNKLWNLMKSI